MYNIHKYVDININGTSILLELLLNENHSVEKIIIASSRAIYGEGKYNCNIHGNVYPNKRKEIDLIIGKFEPTCPFCDGSISLTATDEESKIHPTSIYGITKETQEQLILTTAESLGISAISFRYQNVFGPGQSLSNPYTGILAIFSTNIRNDNIINIYEDGLESRDFVYIDDVVDATILGLEYDSKLITALNVGSGISISVLSVAKLLSYYLKKENNYKISGKYRVGDIRHNYADLNKINKLLGFSPKRSFEEGIKKFTEWVCKQKISSDNYILSETELKSKGLFK